MQNSMINKKNKYLKLSMVIILSMTILSGCTSSTSKVTETASSSDLGYINEIDKTKIMTFNISADQDGWQKMLDNATAKEYISADVTINGTTIKNVGIKPKGNSSLSSVAKDENSDRYSFKIKFDEYVKGQTWMGLDKIVLNSNFSDATSMKEYLSYDILTYIGVKTPLYAYADITVNDKAWGFYLAIEVLDSSYLDRTENGEGELYKPENETQIGKQGGPGNGGMNPNMDPFSSSYSDNMQQRPNKGGPPNMNGGNGGPGGGMENMANNGVSLKYTDDNIESYSAIFDNAETKTDEDDYKRVITALKNLSKGKDLEKYVDVDAVLKYFAAHTFVVNLDSYVSNMGHNYYLYENNGKISILPWDYNLAFGGFQSGSASDVVNFPIDTPVSGVNMEDRPLVAKLLEVPEYKEKYHKYLQEIADGYFSNGKFQEKVNELNTLISDHIKSDPSAFYTYDQYEKAVSALMQLGTLRGESIQGQLNGTIPSTTEDQKLDSGKLIDASSINLSDLGSQGGKDKGGRKVF